jgi:hypothetical protein
MNRLIRRGFVLNPYTISRLLRSSRTTGRLNESMMLNASNSDRDERSYEIEMVFSKYSSGSIKVARWKLHQLEHSEQPDPF